MFGNDTALGGEGKLSIVCFWFEWLNPTTYCGFHNDLVEQIMITALGGDWHKCWGFHCFWSESAYYWYVSVAEKWKISVSLLQIVCFMLDFIILHTIFISLTPHFSRDVPTPIPFINIQNVKRNGRWFRHSHNQFKFGHNKNKATHSKIGRETEFSYYCDTYNCCDCIVLSGCIFIA